MVKNHKKNFLMKKNPLTELGCLSRRLKIIPHLKRQQFLVDLVSALILGRKVLFSELACHMNRSATVESNERRIQDFFQKVEFDDVQLLALLACFVPHQKVRLSMDRTEWDHGSKKYNILVIIASVGKMGVPLYFEMLENNSGNSNSNQRIEVLKKVIRVLGVQRIEWLTMDREFIGAPWLKWLKEQGIRFCVRVPKHHLITLNEGSRCKAEDLLAGKRHLLRQDVAVDCVSLNLSLSYDASGEMLYLIGTIPSQQLQSVYRMRWTIETFFQALKARGFEIEQTALRCANKLRKLFAVVCLAYTICWAVGIENSKIKPVKTKKHGYPQFSVFRRGLNSIRISLKNGFCPIIQLIWQRIEKTLLSLTCKTVG